MRQETEEVVAVYEVLRDIRVGGQLWPAQTLIVYRPGHPTRDVVAEVPLSRADLCELLARRLDIEQISGSSVEGVERGAAETRTHLRLLPG